MTGTIKIFSSLYSLIRHANLLWVIFSIILSIILYLSLNKEFNFDEIELIHTSWKITQGEKIYVDFFQHHHPLLHYLVALLVLILGENTALLTYARIINFCFLVLIFIVTYQLSIRVFDQLIGVISVVFLATTLIFVERAVETRPDVPQTLFNLIGLLYLFTYLESKKIKHLVLCSLASAVAFLFLQKALFVNFLTLILLLFNSRKKNIHYYDLLIYLSITVLVCLPYLAYLIYSNSLNSYVTFNWILNVKFQDRSYPFSVIADIYKANTLMCIFYVLGLFYLVSTFTQKQFKFFSLSLFVLIFLARKSFYQYFMPLIPSVAIISSYAVNSIFNNSKRLIVPILILSIFVPLSTLCQWTNELSNDSQLQKINYVLSLTRPEDYVYDGNVSFNLFRKDIDFFWYSLGQGDSLSTYKSMFNYDYNIYDLIDKYKPKVISNSFIDDMGDSRIINHYRQSSIYEELYIRVSNE